MAPYVVPTILNVQITMNDGLVNKKAGTFNDVPAYSSRLAKEGFV